MAHSLEKDKSILFFFPSIHTYQTGLAGRQRLYRKYEAAEKRKEILPAFFHYKIYQRCIQKVIQ
jgi:hypothetical protein